MKAASIVVALAIVPLAAVAATRLQSVSPLPTLGFWVASAVAGWPLAALAAGATLAPLPKTARTLAGAIGLAAAAVLLWRLQALSLWAYELLDANRAGWPERMAARGVIVLLVEYLWLLGVGGLSEAARAEDLRRFATHPLAWALAIVAAAALPVGQSAYAHARRYDLAAEHLAAGRLAQAAGILRQAQRNGAWSRFRGIELPRALDEIGAEMERIEKRCRAPLPDDCPAEQRIARARELAQLGRTAAALDTLAPIRFSSVEASLLSGAVLQQRKAYSASDAAYQRALVLAADDPRSRELLMAFAERAVNALAYNAREQDQPDRVPEIYEKAEKEWPELAPEFHAELGRHYHHQGRARLAREHFAQAAAADPERYGDWQRRLGGDLDFHRLMTLCSPGGAAPEAGDVGNMGANGLR